MADPLPRDTAEPTSGFPANLRRVLLAVIAVGLLVIAAAGGWLLRGGGGSSPPATNSVDAGFARDMSTHHVQAITMAGYERDNTTNAGLKVLATDIETSQNFQVGQMQGWLDAWGLARDSTTQMAWMGHPLPADSLMPGMATPAQLNRLESLHGKALDILFLQLMIRHHQGGIPMARYALTHAQEPYVRDMAQSIVNAQSAEIIEMERLLRQLGGAPLPAPSTGG